MVTPNPPKAQCWSNEPIPFIATPKRKFSFLSSFSYFSEYKEDSWRQISIFSFLSSFSLFSGYKEKIRVDPRDPKFVQNREM